MAETDASETTVEKDPRFPIQVEYCGVCGLPHEYCENGPCFDKCREDHPSLHPHASGEAAPAPSTSTTTSAPASSSSDASSTAAPKPASKGGKKKVAEASVTLTLTQRSKRKHVTTVAGLEGFGAKLPDACKIFAKKFSCGASVVKGVAAQDEIDVQGDVREDMVDLIHEKFAVPLSAIYFSEGKDRRPARP